MPRVPSLTWGVGEETHFSFPGPIGEALGEAIGEALGEAFGEAIGEAFGEAFGEAIGEAFDEAIGAVKVSFFPPGRVADASRVSFNAVGLDLGMLAIWPIK